MVKTFRLVKTERSGKRRIPNVGFKTSLKRVKKKLEKRARTSRFRIERSK